MANDTDIQIVIEAQNKAQAAFTEVNRQLNLLAGNTKTAGAESTALTGALNQASTALSNQAGVVGTLARSFGLLANPVAIAVEAVTAFGTALVLAAHAASDYQEKIDIMTERTGLASRQIGALKVAASDNGIAFETVERALDIYVRTLGDAQNGTPNAVAAFDRLGISIRDNAGNFKSSGDVFAEVSQKLRSIEDPAERASKAADVFGARSSRALRAITSDLIAMAAVAESKGIIFSPETEAKLRTTDAAFDRLRDDVDGLKLSLQAMAAVSLGPLLTQLADFVDKMRKLSQDPNIMFVIQVLAKAGGIPLPNLNQSSPGEDRQNILLRGIGPANLGSGPGTAGGATGGAAGPGIPSLGGITGLSGTTISGITEVDRVLADYNEQLLANAENLRMAKDATKGHSDAIAATSKSASEAFDYMKFSIESNVSSFVSNAVLGFDTVGNLFQSLVRSMVQSVSESLITSVVKGLISTVASVATGGVLPGPNTPGGGIGPVPLSSPAPGGVTVNVYGHFVDRKSLQEFTSEHLAPILIDTMNKGALRGR